LRSSGAAAVYKTSVRFTSAAFWLGAKAKRYFPYDILKLNHVTFGYLKSNRIKFNSLERKIIFIYSHATQSDFLYSHCVSFDNFTAN
jgi:hypothetical protein